MSKENYREKIEEHRQLIEIEDNNSRMSRSRRNVKKKKRKNPLMTILLFVLIGIPFMILLYVSFIYTPGGEEVAKVDKGGSVVEVETNKKLSSSGKELKDPEIEADKAIAQPVNNQTSTNDDEKSAEEEVSTPATEVPEQSEQEEPANAQNGQHIVQTNDTLYSLAMKYYNSPSGVEKIKSANHLASDSISVGQTLIIP